MKTATDLLKSSTHAIATGRHYIGHPPFTWSWVSLLVGLGFLSIAYFQWPTTDGITLAVTGSVLLLASVLLFSRRNFIDFDRGSFVCCYLWTASIKQQTHFSNFIRLARIATRLGETECDYVIRVVSIPSNADEKPFVLASFAFFGADPSTHEESKSLVLELAQATGIQADVNIPRS